jgi:RNA polymerase sigma factor (sigma-70 family)
VTPVDERDWLAERFEEHRTHLRAVAYRMLGSLSEADDAVQEAWLRLSRTDASEIENLGGWLTTVVARVSLNMLRSRKVRREQPIGVHMSDPIVDRADGTDPEHEALLADWVGLPLLVVLETLSPPERLATRGSAWSCTLRSSTASSEPSEPSTESRTRWGPSPSGAGRSSRWTSSPTPSGSAGST